ncbi:glycosyltransferase family 2 protein [Mucilaginibacter sp. X5P1]|uniref:glycosyltransferase family 2 protein n=1 Tax=Mucilaginibacter sp. X5P1 TaxID=2723088 RepID=UPI00160BCC76|nr:glycosyltransferase family 2 protein [Mucilaginibacter sp. X5P1]MBB6141024.1 glycosyltransferase involved in cell wall biosynthesis [Mucilaginibacter sp. X5P1]
MKENTPVKPIPVPDYKIYREKICKDRSITFPLKSISALSLNDLPAPLNTAKKGWPWDEGSDLKITGNNLPKVSVVVPSYQQGAYIEETLRSILLQNYPILELIIIDGGSSDETVEVVNHYKAFVSLFISEKDNGQSEAINRGFSMASGEIYCWYNSDDFFSKNALNRVVPFFLKDPSLDVLYGDGYILHEETGETVIENAPLIWNRYLRAGGIVLSHSLVWRSSVHCPIWEDLNCAMDAELALRLFTGRKFKHAKFPIGVFRKHAEQKTTNQDKWAQKWKDDYEKFIWKHYPAIKHWTWRLRMIEYRFVQKAFLKYRNLFADSTK